MNALPPIRLYALLLREEDLRWLDDWLKAGDIPGSEQARVIVAVEEKLALISGKEKP